MAIPTITPLSEAPSRQETEETFVPKADALLGQLPEMVTEMNTGFQWIEDQGDLIDTARDETYTARDIALDAKAVATGAANWVGDWETATGAGVAGTSYTYANLYVYLLKVNLANIQSSEPSFTNTDWQLINEIPFEPSVKPTMVLDFANETFEIYDGFGSGFAEKPLNNIVTHTRASSATGVDPIGRVGTVGPNIPRLVFEDGVAKGYLSEESRTNLLTQSEFENGLSDAPTRSGLIALDSMIFGNEDVNAIAFGYDGSTTSTAYKNNFTPVPSTTYQLSVFIEMDDGDEPSFLSATGGSPSNDFVLVVSNTPISALNYTITKSYGNIYRVSTTHTTGATVSSSTGVVKFAGNSPRTFKVTGYQLEVGSFPTSYIKTQASTVTRSADTMVRILGNEWNPNEGAFVVDAEYFGSSDVAGGFYSFSDGTTSNRIAVFFDASGGSGQASTDNISMFVTINDTSYSIISTVKGAGTGFHKVAVSFSSQLILMCVDGVLMGSVNISGLPLVDRLGGQVEGLGMTAARTKRLTYYPKALPANELQELSRL